MSQASYNVLGQPTALTYGNGVTTSYSYHPQNYRPTGIGLPEVLSLPYTYDNAGNIRTLSGAGQTTTSGYDALNRLTSAAGPTGRPTATIRSATC